MSAAPIQRYSDPRLYGVTLTKPFNGSYQWIRTIAHPMHPHCSLIVECAVRAIKIVTGTLALTLTAVPALIGRVVQMAHYHFMSQDDRARPVEVLVKHLFLPGLAPCLPPNPTKVVYHGTAEAAAISILRWGFDPEKTAPGAKLGEAVYVAVENVVPAAYGTDQLELSLDLRRGEVAYLDDSTLTAYKVSLASVIQGEFADKEIMQAIRELFYQNGYRAIKYDLDHESGTEEAFAVCDPSCISIQRLDASARTVPSISLQAASSESRILLPIRA